MRVLLCLGVTDDFCALDPAEYEPLGAAIAEAFDDLEGRFGLEVLGTFDDDVLQQGASTTWPWTCYLLADAPDLEAIVAVTEIVRQVRYRDALLWKYLRVEARVGRRLFFGNA